MSLNSDEPKELSLHLVKCLCVSVLEVSEGLQKSKRASAANDQLRHSPRKRARAAIMTFEFLIKSLLRGVAAVA